MKASKFSDTQKAPIRVHRNVPLAPWTSFEKLKSLS